MTTPSNPYSQPAPIPGAYGAFPPFGRPPADPPAAPQASGGVGTIHDGVLHLDYSDETIRHQALELAVHYTHRRQLTDGPKYTLEVAELFRAYLTDGTVPQ